METSGIVATESTSGVIRFLADSEMMCGGYRLDVIEDRVIVTASDARVFVMGQKR